MNHAMGKKSVLSIKSIPGSTEKTIFDIGAVFFSNLSKSPFAFHEPWWTKENKETFV